MEKDLLKQWLGVFAISVAIVFQGPENQVTVRGVWGRIHAEVGISGTLAQGSEGESETEQAGKNEARK